MSDNTTEYEWRCTECNSLMIKIDMEKYFELYIPKWVSVKDRLPEISKNVLLCYELICFDRKYPDIFIGYLKDNKIWRIGKEDFIFESITHWMPLPEPPEDK